MTPKQLLDLYDQEHFLRTANEHAEGCCCQRCLRDALAASIAENERLTQELQEALEATSAASHLMQKAHADHCAAEQKIAALEAERDTWKVKHAAETLANMIAETEKNELRERFAALAKPEGEP